jgi:hypothetical protein
VTTAKTAAAIALGDLTLRPATLDDAAIAADVSTAAHPEDPEDPLLWRTWWQSEVGVMVAERFIVAVAGTPAGYAIRRHATEAAERFERFNLELVPEHRSAEHLGTLLGFLEARASGEGARRFTAWAWENDARLIDVLGRRGFREERRQRFWELDLRRHAERLRRMADESRARMRAAGIRILTIADDDDPAKWEKLWKMSEDAARDIPTSVPFAASPFDSFMEWMRSPGLHDDRIWIARVNDDIVGTSMLSYPPVRGIVATDWTGTARSVRGKGVARALKCETLVQAVALGVPRVRTDNDWQNAPILHLNKTMGYELLREKIMFLKRT